MQTGWRTANAGSRLKLLNTQEGTVIPALGSAFLGGLLLYLSIYLPIQSIIFAALLAGAGTMALAYSYGSLRQMTR